jgi:uncharacterized membrane protein YtjA (UPF0391 family)
MAARLIRVHETKAIRTYLIANKYGSSGIAANVAGVFILALIFIGVYPVALVLGGRNAGQD